MSNKNSRCSLSVGIDQSWDNDPDRAKCLFWLSLQKSIEPNAQYAINRIQEMEGIVDVERYSALSLHAGDLRNYLANDCDKPVNGEFRRGFQQAINMLMDKIESIDFDTQAATSLAEMQAATVRDAQELIRNADDYKAVGNYAQAIEEAAQ